ncbi:putative Zinc finger RNA-binding protein [Daphnia magna]|uniref:Putative Zinc finger RNA-binding protein n=1 Tax=Daphnia magna TaxID=35525 RepID=A0A164FZP2_9CRUS|nr:putative Zinc finger RNA-binding protein [Daphnia magna]
MTAAVATETAQAVVAQWEEEKVIQPVGQDYVEELRGVDDFCFNDLNAKDMYVKGRRLRIIYKKKVDLNLVVEAKGWPALRQKNNTMPGWQERRKPNEGGCHVLQPIGLAHPEADFDMVGYQWVYPPPPECFPSGSLPMGIPNPSMRKP